MVTRSVAHFNQRFRAACRAHADGQYAEAIAALQTLLLEEPANGECLHMLALSLLAAGRTAEAARMATAAVTLDARNTRWLRTQAHVLYVAGNLPGALAAIDHLLELTPHDSGAWNDLGIYLRQAGQQAPALAAFMQAEVEDAGNWQAINNIGAILQAQGDLDAAEEHFTRALTLNPAYADAASNLGTVSDRRGEYAEAARRLLAALAIEPQHADATGHLGAVLSALGHPDAERYLRRALELQPGNWEKQLNLGMHLMRHGHFAEGWQLYEARWRAPSSGQQLPVYPQPLWLGEPLHGTTLLVHAEQGFGDTFHFLRYLPLLLEQGGSVVLQVQPALLPLLQRYAAHAGYDERLQLLAQGAPLPGFDWHTPLLSVPGRLGSRPESVPPPLRLTPDRPREKEKEKGAALRVGLAWAGSPSHARDRERSLSLETLVPLFEVEGIQFVSLQKQGTASGQVVAPAAAPLDQPDVETWEAVAEVLDTLDLVIAVDSAVAHLAASQRVPVWLLLPLAADWRWELTLPGSYAEPVSRWYPRTRLFRQQKMAGRHNREAAWQPVVARVAAALRAQSREASAD